MSEVQAAIYARVSSDRQVSEHTIASQVAGLQERPLPLRWLPACRLSNPMREQG